MPGGYDPRDTWTDGDRDDYIRRSAFPWITYSNNTNDNFGMPFTDQTAKFAWMADPMPMSLSDLGNAINYLASKGSISIGWSRSDHGYDARPEERDEEIVVGDIEELLQDNGGQ